MFFVYLSTYNVATTNDVKYPYFFTALQNLTTLEILPIFLPTHSNKCHPWNLATWQRVSYNVCMCACIIQALELCTCMRVDLYKYYPQNLAALKLSPHQTGPYLTTVRFQRNMVSGKTHTSLLTHYQIHFSLMNLWSKVILMICFILSEMTTTYSWIQLLSSSFRAQCGKQSCAYLPRTHAQG